MSSQQPVSPSFCCCARGELCFRLPPPLMWASTAHLVRDEAPFFDCTTSLESPTKFRRKRVKGWERVQVVWLCVITLMRMDLSPHPWIRGRAECAVPSTFLMLITPGDAVLIPSVSPLFDPRPPHTTSPTLRSLPVRSDAPFFFCWG